MTAKWTDDDKPFIEVERGIARLEKRGVNLRAKLPSYRAEAIADMTNRQKLYRWAYATNRVIKPLDFAIGAVSTTSPQLQDKMYEVLMRPAAPDQYIYQDENYKRLFYAKKVPSPIRSYRYSRMLFIMAAMRSQNTPLPEFRKLGDRLLKRNPRDFEVKSLCVDMAGTEIISSIDPVKPEPEKMLRYANELVRANPRNPDYLLVLSGAQLMKENLSGAKATCQRYLKLTPINASHRYIASYQIKLIAKSEKIRAESRGKQ